MPHINLPEGLPGIRGLMAFRPEIAKPLNELAETLLRSENSLTRGERELIATYVDGLATWAPQDREIYVKRGKQRAEEGYINFDPYRK